MYIRQIRQERHLSQEQLAELCALSLRTIQRVESGHRVSFASMRALAAGLKLNVDELERKLYSLDTVALQYEDYPLWVRVACGKGWFSASRSELIKIELFTVSISVIGFFVWFSQLWIKYSFTLPFFELNLADFFGACSVGCLFCAYNFSIAIRVGDRFDLWSKLEATQPRGLFGVFKPSK